MAIQLSYTPFRSAAMLTATRPTLLNAIVIVIHVVRSLGSESLVSHGYKASGIRELLARIYALVRGYERGQQRGLGRQVLHGSA